MKKRGEKNRDREHYDNNAAEAANWQTRFTKMTDESSLESDITDKLEKYVSNADKDDDDVNLIRICFARCSSSIMIDNV